MKKEFYSNGKLLLTGEYVVLDGALALAVPTKYGQSMEVTKIQNPVVEWKGYDNKNELWIDVTFDLNDIINFSGNIENETTRLLHILHQCYQMQTFEAGICIKTKLNFPRFWGLGTSSTLINNLAQWLKIDAWELLDKTFGGSGYDIACAKNNSPIIYQLKEGNTLIKTIEFQPKFRDKLYFLYLNQKQNSQQEIKRYYNQHKDIKQLKKLNKITKKIIETTDFDEFCSLMDLHEVVMSNLLRSASIKETFFPDFDGSIKSLGAWGGDFVLVMSESNPKDYFEEREFKTLIPYDEMVLH